jgi:hypothetical protein
VEDVYYLGGTSNILYFIELLERELEVRIRALDLLTPKDTVEYEEDLKQYTLASSAILYKKYNYFNDLNFSKNTRFQINLTPIIVGIACASIVMHAGTYYVNTKYDEHIEELQQVQRQQNSSIERLNSEMSSINSSNSSARMSIDAINGLLAQQKWLSDILYILPGKVPTDTIISNILCEEGNILLKGYTTNYSDIGFFAIALEEFGQVTVDVIENDVTEPISPIEIEGVDDISDEDKISKSFVISLMYNGSRLDNTVIKTNGSTEPVETSEEIVERNLDIQVEKPSEDIVDADVEP